MALLTNHTKSQVKHNPFSVERESKGDLKSPTGR